MKRIVAIAALAAVASGAQAQVVISEILGSTSGSDAEFLEIANTGGAPVDISGYTIELWDSNDDPAKGGTNAGWGGSDGSAPYVVPAATILAPGAVFTWMGPNAMTDYSAPFPTDYLGTPFGFDVAIPTNAVENSSYTAILTSSLGGAVLDSVFVLDDPALDTPNRNGTPIVPVDSIGPTGAGFLPAGFYRGSINELNFNRAGGTLPTVNDGTLAGGTPGIYQIPTPATAALMGVAGFVGFRRRR